MPTYKLTIEYDGGRYAGWQRQLLQPTVQAALEQAVEAVTRRSATIIGAGRTDSGVHALGQVASFRSEKVLTGDQWMRALNALLPRDISVLSAERVSDDFHARYSARRKLYEYRIVRRPARPALDRERAWHLHVPLDVAAMREAASLLTGRRDFASFQGHPTDTVDTVCDVNRVELVERDPLLCIRLEADRFLKQMVRAIVGTLADVGRGKRPPQSVTEILAARHRSAAGYTAPAHGLYLVRVEY